ncbi:MAG: hypothetical protein K2H31_05540 [Lachnospiraceae bacterium]|nr:hypothetical protein [Lachnospiraceae bacterium]
MDEFKISYQKAYEHILPKPDYLENIIDKVDEQKRKQRSISFLILRPAAAICAVVLLLSVTVLPVAARNFPQVYNIIDKYAPALADFVLPVQTSDTSNGITMQVEAIDIKDNTAEVIVSFYDADGSDKDLIKGSIDLYDSYYLQSYGASYEAGGCEFLEYDELEDKAYFKISLFTDGSYRSEKVRFGVHQILTNKSREKQWIELDNIIKNPKMKSVSYGGGGNQDSELYNQYFGDSVNDSSQPGGLVMDIVEVDESMIEALTVTGVGYSDGVLRIQTCRGNFSDADRHMRSFLIDSMGNERDCDLLLGWQEEINGESVSFDEHLFIVDESELNKIQIYGIFHTTENGVKGNWEVTFELKPFAE